MSTKTEGRIKKIAASRSKKPAPKVETMQDLKDATDKYFSVRDVALDIRALEELAVHILSRYRVDCLHATEVVNLQDRFLAEWNNSNSQYRDAKEVSLDLITNIFNELGLVLTNLSRLNFEERTNA